MVCLCKLVQFVLLRGQAPRRLVFSTRYNPILAQHRSQHSPQPLPLREKSKLDVRTSLSIWKKQRNSQGFQKFLYSCFSEQDDLPAYFVSLINQACGIGSSCSPDLIFNMLVNLNKYLEDNSIVLSLDSEHIIEVLNSVNRYRNLNLIQMICYILKLNGTRTGFIIEYIDELVRKKKFIEAAYCISVLNLQDDYYMEEVFFPLLMEGKTHVVILCLNNLPDLQLKMAKMLDARLEVPNITETKANSNIYTKRIFKTLSTFITSFNISPEHCENLHCIRSKGALNVLIKKKEQQSIAEDTWLEMVMAVINGNIDLKKHLIYKLLLGKDNETAVKMIKTLSIEDCDVKEIIANVQTVTKLPNIEEADLELDESENENSTSCLSFTLPQSAIKYISTKEDFLNSMEDITRNYKMVGIDTEWKPHFGLSQERLSLVQIAVYDKVYILDVLALNEIMGSCLWSGLMDAIFSNKNIIKLGLGIMSDVQMIVESHKNTHGRSIHFSHILDMAVLYQKLQEVYPEELGDEESSKGFRKSLSSLCEILLGHPLNKEERLCDWEKRPLRPSQLEYAALDAHCLLLMFEKLKQLSIEKVMNFNHLVKVSIVKTQGLWKSKKRTKVVSQEETLQVQVPLPIKSFKVAVDSHLKSQGQELRFLGADVFILSDNCTPQMAEQISILERRLLLCSNDFYKKMQTSLPAANCFKIAGEDDDEEEVSVSHILQKFNVQLRMKNILSRCTICNSESCIKLTEEDAKFLYRAAHSGQFLNCDNPELRQALENMKISGAVLKNIKPSSVSDAVNLRGYLCTKCGNVYR